MLISVGTLRSCFNGFSRALVRQSMPSFVYTLNNLFVSQAESKESGARTSFRLPLFLISIEMLHSLKLQQSFSKKKHFRFMMHCTIAAHNPTTSHTVAIHFKSFHIKWFAFFTSGCVNRFIQNHDVHRGECKKSTSDALRRGWRCGNLWKCISHSKYDDDIVLLRLGRWMIERYDFFDPLKTLISQFTSLKGRMSITKAIRNLFQNLSTLIPSRALMTHFHKTVKQFPVSNDRLHFRRTFFQSDCSLRSLLEFNVSLLWSDK